jgi:hypothetical protein
LGEVAILLVLSKVGAVKDPDSSGGGNAIGLDVARKFGNFQKEEDL